MMILLRTVLKRCDGCSQWRAVLNVILTIPIFLFSTVGLAQELLPTTLELQFSPAHIYAVGTSEVRVAIGLTHDDNLIKSSASLYYLNENNQSILVGQLYDDATHGDSFADDFMFVTKLNMNESQPRTVPYFVSAYYGETQKITPIVYFETKPAPNLEGIWTEFVGKMSLADLDGALLCFRESKRAFYRAAYLKVGMGTVSAAFQTATNLARTKIWMGEAEYTFNMIMGGTNAVGTMTFSQDSFGNWRIERLGFK